MPTPRRLLRSTLLALPALAGLASPALAEEPPTPAPAGDAPAPAPAPAAGDPAAPAPAAPATEEAPVFTIAEAYARLERARGEPARGPGALVRQLERLRNLGETALRLPAAKEAAGDDLYRLGELAAAAEKHADAAGFLAAYLRTPEPRAFDAEARAALVRDAARAGNRKEAGAALDELRKAHPRSTVVPRAAKHLADAMVEAGELEPALALYREASTPGSAAAPDVSRASLQSASEVLVALGRAAEARKDLQARLAGTTDARAAEALKPLLRRVEMVGNPFAPPRVARWEGGAAPDPAALRGKVVVHHFFLWWMEARLEELADWEKDAARLAPKGLVVLPVTMAAGWNPATGRQERDKRKIEEEAADAAKAVRTSGGWTGVFGICASRNAFEAAGIRAYPTEIVVGRDGLVKFVRVSGETGPALARRVAEAALADPVPTPATPPKPGDAPGPGAAPPAGGAGDGDGAGEPR